MELSKERVEEINKIIDVFSYSKVQALITMSELFDSRGITIDEVKEFILMRREMAKTNEKANEKIRERNTKTWEKFARRCPVCNRVLQLRKITEPKGKGNMKGYTSNWLCVNEECTFEEYGFEDVNEVHQKIMEGTYNADN